MTKHFTTYWWTELAVGGRLERERERGRERVGEREREKEREREGERERERERGWESEGGWERDNNRMYIRVTHVCYIS